MYGQLIPVGGGNPLPLLSQRLIVGRHPQCDLTLPSKTVSGRHCELKQVDGYWWVRDLDSQNGTGVNGKRCTSRRLQPNDTLHVARLRFRVVYDPPATAESSVEDFAMSFLDSDSAVTQRSSESAGDTRRTAKHRSTADQDSRHSASTVIDPPAADKPAPEPAVKSAPAPRSSGSSPPADKSSAGGSKLSRRYLGKLVPCGGGDLLPLLQETLVIGRRSGCDLTIKSSTVSSEHCRLQFLDGFWTVEDLNSSNGVRVDGQRVRQKVLMPGCTLSVAKHRYTVEYTPEAALPPEVDVPYVEGSADGRPITGSLLESIGLDSKALDERPPSWLIEDEEPQKEKYRLDEY